jgi:hypothetical protein
MAKKRIAVVEDGLTTVAVTVGTALGKLAHTLGLGETPAPSAPKPPKKAATRKSATPNKKGAPKKKAATKKATAKRPALKKAKSPAKKA